MKFKKQSLQEEIMNKDLEKEITEEIKETPETAEVEPETQQESMEQMIIRLEKEKDEFKDKYIRSVAEFDNYRKQNMKDRADWIKNATEKLVLELIDVYDDFERSLNIDIGENFNQDAYLLGVKQIFLKFENLLKKEGVSKVEAQGAEFDPVYHEALAYIPSELDENKIAAIIQNGYTMNNKLIRPVKVAVSKGKETKE